MHTWSLGTNKQRRSLVSRPPHRRLVPLGFHGPSISHNVHKGHQGFIQSRKSRDLFALHVKCFGAKRPVKVRVQFYAQLRELVGVHELEPELPQGATVRDLLEEIYAKAPALRGHDKNILIGAGLEFVDRNYKLNPGEEIAIMPPVQGG